MQGVNTRKKIFGAKNCLRSSSHDISEFQRNPWPIHRIISGSIGIFEIACQEVLRFFWDYLGLIPSVKASILCDAH